MLFIKIFLNSILKKQKNSDQNKTIKEKVHWDAETVDYEEVKEEK
jgi:hypothetical protein